MPLHLRHQPMQIDEPVAIVTSKLPDNGPQHLAKTVANTSDDLHTWGHVKAKSHGCTTTNTVFDLGFYDGGDSAAYLTGGYCVVGIEADPDLVAAANQKFAAHIATGQLRMLNAAVSPEGDAAAWSKFYKSHCTKEWNSFYETIGCRKCVPPHAVDHTMCTEVKVTATDCSGIFTNYGTPLYLKLDIEGAETGCFQAMSHFGGKPLPQFVSAEITQIEYIETLHKLGYKGFKLVRQDHLNTVQAQSGPWGEHAMDCKTGGAWRTYEDMHAEFTTVLSKPHSPTEACPGGVMPIHGPPKPASSYIWYDIHAVLVPPPTPPAAR